MIDRRGRHLPLDAHLHTDLSPDSDVPIDAFAEQAVERGIAEIAITDHVDFEPDAPAYGFTTFEQRERVVREAAERWADRGVAIRFGVELTYDRSWEDDIREHLRRHTYDFTIGSWHDRFDSQYSESRVAAWIAGRSFADIVAPYFDEVLAAARSGLFDAIGHIDVVKRYTHPHRHGGRLRRGARAVRADPAWRSWRPAPPSRSTRAAAARASARRTPRRRSWRATGSWAGWP